jgi:hypothetical protein
MGRHRRLRRTTAPAALCAALAVSAAAPSLASGQNVVDDLLKDLGLGAQGATQAAGVLKRSGHKPHDHGSIPDAQGDAQGTTGTLDFSSSNDPPPSGKTTSEADGGHENVVLGRSHGEQVTDGIYDGAINVLSLFGFDVVPPAEPGQGETASGPLEPIQQNVLDAICTGSGGQLCLAGLPDDSGTTNSDSTSPGSRNSFNGFNLRIGGRDGAPVPLPESNGNIQREGGTPTRSNDTRPPFGTAVSLPCESENQDAEFTVFSPVRSVVCNGSNWGGESANGAGEDPIPTGHHWLGTREALALVLLQIILGMALLLAPSIVEGHRRPSH